MKLMKVLTVETKTESSSIPTIYIYIQSNSTTPPTIKTEFLKKLYKPKLPRLLSNYKKVCASFIFHTSYFIVHTQQKKQRKRKWDGLEIPWTLSNPEESDLSLSSSILVRTLIPHHFYCSYYVSVKLLASYLVDPQNVHV